jgi:hypothetical protein
MRHSWGQPLRPDLNNTRRTCSNCGMIKITRHESDNRPQHWIEFELEGRKVDAAKTPACTEAVDRDGVAGDRARGVGVHRHGRAVVSLAGVPDMSKRFEPPLFGASPAMTALGLMKRVLCPECLGRGMIKLWSPGHEDRATMARCEQCSGFGKVKA